MTKKFDSLISTNLKYRTQAPGLQTCFYRQYKQLYQTYNHLTALSELGSLVVSGSDVPSTIPRVHSVLDERRIERGAKIDRN